MSLDESTQACALGIFSGGLDSMLAVKVLQDAGVRVVGVTFETPFFGAERARASAKHIGLELMVESVGPEHLAMVKNPPHGYGSNMNPCIDCHAFMFAKAGGIMERMGLDFLFSGEVLGQRPMSQNKQALATVAKASGYADKILRPLSAKLLPPTAMEESGLVEREMLLDLKGRGRKPQMALARQMGISDYPAPAGGCLLTEPGFSRRLADLLEHHQTATVREVELLKHGRHLRLSPEARLIVGRNQADNRALDELAPQDALKLAAVGVPGPLSLYFGPREGPELEQAAAIVAGYGKAEPGSTVQVSVSGGQALNVQALSRRLAAPLLL